MMIERESKKKASELKSGTVFDYSDGISHSTAILIEDSDGKNPIIFDLNDDCYYTDVDNYIVDKIIDDYKICIYD